MKKTVVTFMALVVLAICSTSFAALPAPTGLSVTPGWWGINFNWNVVTGAEKYSVDVKGEVWYRYWDQIEIWPDFYIWILKWDKACVSVSMGTSDWYICDMADPFLWISKPDFACLLAEAIETETGNVPVFISGFWGEAKVKALAPHLQKGRQNNPFSLPADCNVWLNIWLW